MVKMICTKMKDNMELYAPEDWILLNESSAFNSKHVCVVSIPEGEQYGGNKVYAYFSNDAAQAMDHEYKQSIYRLVDVHFPHFLQLRTMTPDGVIDAREHKEKLGELLAKKVEKQMGAGLGETIREMISNAPDENYMEYMCNKMRMDEEMITRILAYSMTHSPLRYGIFDIFKKGEDPYGGDVPYGAMIRPAGKEVDTTQ